MNCLAFLYWSVSAFFPPLGLDTNWQILPAVVVTPTPPAPSSPVAVGLANTSGGDPDVATAAGPAPTTAPGIPRNFFKTQKFESSSRN
jgi:hypothetical protein